MGVEKRIIIPGGAGFVGRNLTRVLSSQNYNMESITILDKDEKNLDYVKKYGVKVVHTNLAEKGDWYKEFQGKEVVINLVAQISSLDQDLFYKNNVLSVKNVVEASKLASVSAFIHFSSAAVLSVRKDKYAQTKIEGEEIVKKSGIPYCILQPSLIYGPTDNKNIGFLIDFANKFSVFPIPGHGKWPRQPIYVDDICYLVISIINNFPCNKTLNINGREIIYFRDMIKIVLKELNGLKFRIFLPIPLFKFIMMSYQKLVGKVQFTLDQVDSLTAGEVFPSYKWWEEFNVPTTPFEKGVKRMIESNK